MRRMRHLLTASLALLLLLPSVAASRDSKGALAEVLTESNEWINLELREVAPSPRSGSLLFSKKLEATPEQIAWYEIALGPQTKETSNLREIRIADAPLKLKSTSGDLLFYPVVLITGDETEARSASWHWLGERLLGVTRKPGERSRPISIPLSSIKVVRFPKP